MGKVYYMINSRWEVKEAPKIGPKYKQRKAAGNCFETEDMAIAMANAIKQLEVQKSVHYTVKLKGHK